MECARSEFEYFAPQLLQTSIERTFKREYSPISALKHGSPIEFIVPGTDNLALDLARSYIYVKARIRTAALADIPGGADVGPANLTIHSLFSSVDVELGGKCISDTNGLYAYRAMIETLLSYGQEAKDSWLQSELWHKDTSAQINNTVSQPGQDRNVGLQTRARYFDASREVEMLGRPHADIFHQGLAIPDNCELKLRLIPNKDSFLLKTPAPANIGAQENYIFDITEAKLIIQTLQIERPLSLAIAQTLERSNARFKIRRVTLKHLPIAQGLTTIHYDQVYNGLIPERIVLAMVNDGSFNGSYQANPFYFRHFDINYLSLYVNGQMIPSRPYQPDFENGRYIREYNSLFEGSCTQFANKTVPISRSEFGNGFTIFVFDLTADQMCAACTAPPTTGNVALEMKFAHPTPNTINIICFAEFDSLFEIDKYRNVIIPNL